MASVSKKTSRRSSLGMSRTASMSSMNANQAQGPPRGQRIPLLLQSVFLRSNRGMEVNKPPPNQTAQKVFRRNWVFRRSEPVQSSKKKYEKSKDKVLSENKKKGTKTRVKRDSVTGDTPVSTRKIGVVKNKDLEYTLQEYFDALLQERGYNPQLFNTIETAYYNTPTELQIASYGSRMIQIVKSSDAQALRETFMGGLSPNPCNKFGESLLHMVCRRGDLPMLKVMVEAGAVVEVSDDYGRTPLHDACWAANPAFEVVKVLLARDTYMFFMKDKRGSLPLSYVHKADWSLWKEWLDENIDAYFPEHKAMVFHPSDLCGMKPNCLPLPEGKTDLSMELIGMIAKGDMSPREARVMADTAGAGDDDATVADTMTDYDQSEYDSDSDFDSDDNSEGDSDEDSCLDMGEQDLMEMLHIANKKPLWNRIW